MFKFNSVFIAFLPYRIISHQFTNMDYTDIECQKRLIKTFLNSVFVYDNKVVLTFNYSGDNRTITLKEIDAGLQQGVRIPETNAYQKWEVPYGASHLCFPEGTRR